MRKFNYNEPEFKVVCVNAQDVLTGSLDPVGEDFNAENPNRTPGENALPGGFGL